MSESTWVADRLGVKIGEQFKILGFDNNVLFRLLPDGTFETIPPTVSGSTKALLKALESPESIYLHKQWTEEEKTVAQALRTALGRNALLRRTGSHTLLWRYLNCNIFESPFASGELPPELFPSLPCGCWTTLDYIIGGNE